jgi:hypothetical protein
MRYRTSPMNGPRPPIALLALVAVAAIGLGCDDACEASAARIRSRYQECNIPIPAAGPSRQCSADDADYLECKAECVDVASCEALYGLEADDGEVFDDCFYSCE